MDERCRGRERMLLVKTIFSMANARGGTIKLRSVTSGVQNFDSAPLLATVNRYKLAYTAAHLNKVDPADTSQPWTRCGYTEGANRRLRS